MSRNFVVGDIHGAHKALMQCFEKASFDFDKDRLISLGDISDSWPDTKKTVKVLLKIKNLIFIQGNHDYWTLQWAKSGMIDTKWLRQGGKSTIESYKGIMSEKHLQFFKSALPYYIDNKRCFIHGGFDTRKSLKKQNITTFMWDRSLFQKAFNAHLKQSKKKITEFDEVYIGHTPLIRFGYKKPIEGGGVWMMDTGAGWSGKLSMMNIDTKELFQSSYIYKLYPNFSGRT